MSHKRKVHTNGNAVGLSTSSGIKARRSLHDSSSIATDNEDSRGSFTSIKNKQESNFADANSKTDGSKRRSFLYLAIFFSIAVAILYFTYSQFPELDEDEKQHIKLPRNIEDAKQLGLVLTKYRKDHYPQVLLAVFVVYIFLQTFAIPGSIFLSILSGYLFPFYTALILVCTCSALGASLCYGITQLVGRRIVIRYWPEKVDQWSKQVDHHREHMLNYIIFLRITPFLPNWFINIASPVINVQLIPFTLGTFIGVAPPSFLLIQTGTTLYEMTESTSNFTWGRVIFLGSLAILSLLPVIFKKKLRSQLE